MSSHFSNPCLISFWERFGCMLFKFRTELLAHWPHHHIPLTSLHWKGYQSRKTMETMQTEGEVTLSELPAAKGSPPTPLCPASASVSYIAPFIHQNPSLGKGSCGWPFRCQREQFFPAQQTHALTPQLLIPAPHPQLTRLAWHQVLPQNTGGQQFMEIYAYTLVGSF